MDPNLIVIKALVSFVWITVGVALAVLLVVATVALFYLIGILRSTRRMVKIAEQKVTLVNNTFDKYLGLLVKKVSAFFSGKKSAETGASDRD